MVYSYFEHRHRFAVWAGARATQRAFTSVKNLRDALEQTNVRNFLEVPDSFNVNADQFESKHREWCNSIVDFLSERGVKNATYGRAAKLIAIYLKSMVVLTEHSASNLATVTHPPIDRILLQNLAASQEIKSQYKASWRIATWTTLNECDYYELIAELRSVLPAPEPWWKLERYWTVTNE